jgi:Flp pilus assembly protein TadD
VGLSHYFLGVIFTAMPGRLPDAIAHLREAVRMRPDDAESRGALDGALRARSTALTRKPPD